VNPDYWHLESAAHSFELVWEDGREVLLNKISSFRDAGKKKATNVDDRRWLHKLA